MYLYPYGIRHHATNSYQCEHYGDQSRDAHAAVCMDCTVDPVWKSIEIFTPIFSR